MRRVFEAKLARWDERKLSDFTATDWDNFALEYPELATHTRSRRSAVA